MDLFALEYLSSHDYSIHTIKILITSPFPGIVYDCNTKRPHYHLPVSVVVPYLSIQIFHLHYHVVPVAA